MSLKPQEIDPIPEETARIAHAAYPKGNVFMRMRDELGTIYQDEAFAHLFSPTGQPADAPWRLALVPVMQFARSDFPIVRPPMRYAVGSTSSMRLSFGTRPPPALTIRFSPNSARVWLRETANRCCWRRCSRSLGNEDGGIRARQATHGFDACVGQDPRAQSGAVRGRNLAPCLKLSGACRTRVQPHTVVDNSDNSPTRLTAW